MLPLRWLRPIERGCSLAGRVKPDGGLVFLGWGGDLERSENELGEQAIAFLVQVHSVRGEDAFGRIFRIVIFELIEERFPQVEELGLGFAGNFPADVGILIEPLVLGV